MLPVVDTEIFITLSVYVYVTRRWYRNIYHIISLCVCYPSLIQKYLSHC